MAHTWYDKGVIQWNESAFAATTGTTQSRCIRPTDELGPEAVHGFRESSDDGIGDIV